MITFAGINLPVIPMPLPYLLSDMDKKEPKMRDRWLILKDLVDMVCSHQPATIVEVGVSRGINASKLLKSCPNIEKMYLIDNSDSVFDIGLFVNDEHRIQFIRKDSLDAIQYVKEQPNLVFIDADHGYNAVYNDIKGWWPKIPVGGILCGHDYIEGDHKDTEVSAAVKEWAKEARVTIRLEQDTCMVG